MFSIQKFTLIFLWLCSLAFGNQIRDFKVALMYYSEAYLKGATLGSVKLEGEQTNFVTEKIYMAIGEVDIENKWNEAPWKDLKAFQVKLGAGNTIYKSVLDCDFSHSDLRKQSQKIQQQLVNSINKNNGIVLPSGWKGHAIVLMIKPGNQVRTYDFTVVNTGDGIGYHHHVSDPNGIYPLLSRVWVEFKGIPEKELFSLDAWFVQGLIALNSCNFVDKVINAIDKKDESLSIYYYTSFLANFTDYLVSVDKGKDIQIPMQRSGSCTVSSIMGALLYESKDKNTFHLYRGKIGNVLLNEIFKAAEKNTEFIRVTTDGFDVNGRSFLKGLISSMAHNVLEYLETGMPKEFKHAGLIGSGRSSWLYENKMESISALKRNKEALKLISETIKTSNIIIKFLDRHRIRNNSTCIKVQDNDLAKLNKNTGMPDKGELILSLKTKSLRSDVNEFIQGAPDRPHLLKIETFKDFKDALGAVASKLNNSKYMYMILDIFNANIKWSDLINDANGPDLLYLQEIAIKIVKSFSKSSLKTSFEDIVTLLLLEKLVWRCTVVYDRKAPLKSKMCESSFNLSELVPETLGKIIFNAYVNEVTKIQLLNWGFHNVFDSSSIRIFKDMMEEYNSKKTQNNLFQGPESFSSPYFHSISFQDLKPQAKIKIYDHKIVLEKFEQLKQAKKTWATAKENEAKSKIVHYHSIDKLKPIFPHYYNLMDALAILQSAAIGRVENDKSLDHWIKWTENTDYYENEYAVKKNSNYLLFNGPIDVMTDIWVLNSPYRESTTTAPTAKDIFYRFLHKNIMDCSYYFSKANYQFWLNYIKDANNARIFDSAYFQYITDHLLNNPDNYFENSLDPNLAEEIIDGMTNLISTSLLRLHDNSVNPLTLGDRRTLVLRASNISILLTRFISQQDLYMNLHGNYCAKKLAEVYGIMQPYSYLLSKYKMTAVEVSYVNFAMFFICSTPIRNNKTFMNHLTFDKCTAVTYRKTLEKFHWFIANTNFLSNGLLMGVIFDQFNYGMMGSPLSVNETGFMEYLLKVDFIRSKYEDPSDMTEFKFRSNGFIVEINSSKPQEKDKKYLIINLAKGTIVSDGKSLVSSNLFINSIEFQDFFKTEDLTLALAGHAIEAAGMTFYSLPDFKGINYILVYRNNIGNQGQGSGIITIHRKWNDKWYRWKTAEGCLNFIKSLNYNWIYGTKFFKRKDNVNADHEELLIYPDDTALDPLITASIHLRTGSVKVLVRGMSGTWTVLEDGFFEKHIRHFAEDDFILAKNDLGRLVAIYPGLRLPEDPERPLVLEEIRQNDGKYDFIVRNVPNMKINRVQALGGVYSLPGGLVAINESKKVLLLPLIEVFKKCKTKEKKEEHKKLKQIQKIPIVDDTPAPQARMHKLLLAYYLILSGNYMPAKELLNPASSLHQNEPFDDEELEVIDWITKIKTAALEATALKLVVNIHKLINKSKFPLCFEKYPVDVDVSSLAFDHLISIRELSEKYYIYRIFPEVLREPLFTKVFGRVNSIMSPVILGQSNDFSGLILSFDKHNHNSEYHQFGTIMNMKNFIYFLKSVENNPDYDYLNLTKRLMHKGHADAVFSNRLELLIYCMISTPNKFSNLRNEYNNWKKKGNIYTNFTYLNDSEVKTKCYNEFNKFFQPVNQSLTMTQTSLNDLKNTMIEDLRKVSLDVSSISLNSNYLHLVTDDDVNIMKNLKESLEKIIQNDDGLGLSSPAPFRFNSSAETQSPVLRNLGVSMEQFIKEKGQNRLTQINLSSSTKIIENFDKLRNHLKTRLSQFSSDQNKAITELALSTTSQIHSSAINSIISLMHSKKTKTFKSLYSCYLQDSLACIQRKFPQLNLKTCLALKDSAFLFFSRQILIDYFTMLSKISEGFLKSNDPISSEDLTIFCDELAKIERFNERVKDPVIMNFEFRSGKYRLRAEQVDDIDKLTKLDSNTNLFQSIVIQRMMAAGKTLVLGTISIVKKAMDKSRLSILVPPSSLYQSNTTAMQARTYQYFKKKGRNFSFPRFNLPVGEHAVLVKQYLENVIDLIKDSMRTQNYIVLSPDTLHSYLNSYIEVLLNAEDRWDTDHYQDILRLYSEIYRIFKTRSSIILDEIDMIMDPRKELNFPTQETEPYNMIAAALLADIMEFMVFDEDIINAGLDIHSNNQASLTPENYEKCRILVLKYIKNQLNDTCSIWNELVCKGTKKTHAEIMQFLNDKDMTAMDTWIKELHNESGVIANALIIVKSQLYQYMEDALKGTVNQNFGTAGNSRLDIKYAVPYVAANTPSLASVFADRWETLLKTLLMVSASPCSFNTAKDVIIYAKKSILSESAGNFTFESTPAYNNMKLILPPGMNPILLDENSGLNIEIVQRALEARTPAAIRVLFTFYLNQVFSKMTFPIEQITSNALHIASMFGSVQGYSGTIDNVNILPQCVIAYAYEDHEKNEKNNGGISLKLIMDCNDDFVSELHGDSFKKTVEEMVKDLFGLFKEDVISNVSAIIDTGAFFKNFKNRQVAEAVLTASSRKFEAGLYYDEDSNQLEFVRKSGNSFSRGFLDTTDPDDITKATEADLSKRFTFYDQRHITGTDILQPKTANALMTAGPRVLLRDILQGTLRMRQFMTSQKVHLVSTEASRLFYYSKIKANDQHVKVKVSDILALGALNEDEKQVTENEKLAFAKIGVEIRGFVLDEISRILTDSSDILGKKSEIIGIFNCAKIIFLRLISEDPLSWLQRKEMKGSAEALKTYAINLLRPLEHQFNTKKSSNVYKRYNSVKKRIKNMVDESNKSKNDSLLKYLGDKINTRLQSENGTEVQMQTLTLTMIDINMDQLIDEINVLNQKLGHKYAIIKELISGKDDIELEAENEQFVNFEHLFENQKIKNNNKDQIPLLDAALMTKGKRIGITRDLIELLDMNSTANRYPIFSKYTLEGSHLLVQEYNQNVKIVLISPKHAALLCPFMYSEVMKSKFWLCDLSGTVSQTNLIHDKNIGQNVLDFIPEARYLIFDLLIFNGSLPQILKNPILRNIYENEWLAADTFKERATFLLFRMKILFEKCSIMFEDDDIDLSNLKKLAMGKRDPTTKVTAKDVYPKTKVLETFETSAITRLKLNLSLGDSSIKKQTQQTKTKKFDLYAEILNLFQITESSINHNKAPIQDSYKLVFDKPFSDEDADNDPETSITINKHGILTIKTLGNDVNLVANVKSIVKISSNLQPTNVGPTTNNIRVETLDDYKEPELNPWKDIFNKKIKINSRSLIDTKDLHDSDIEIEQLLTMDDIDVSNQTDNLDEDIDDRPPGQKPEVGDIGYSFIEGTAIIIIIVILAASAVGYIIYRRKCEKIEDIELNASESIKNENQEHDFKFIEDHGHCTVKTAENKT
jgi:gas vesicle protein